MSCFVVGLGAPDIHKLPIERRKYLLETPQFSTDKVTQQISIRITALSASLQNAIPIQPWGSTVINFHLLTTFNIG